MLGRDVFKRAARVTLKRLGADGLTARDAGAQKVLDDLRSASVLQALQWRGHTSASAESQVHAFLRMIPLFNAAVVALCSASIHAAAPG